MHRLRNVTQQRCVCVGGNNFDTLDGFTLVRKDLKRYKIWKAKL